jgi:hypothetical protein
MIRITGGILMIQKSSELMKKVLKVLGLIYYFIEKLNKFIMRVSLLSYKMPELDGPNHGVFSKVPRHEKTFDKR